MQIFADIAREVFTTFYLAAPFLLFGLVVAGFIHVLLPASAVQRFLGRPGLRGVLWAAILGIPLPVCSCGVVPIVVEMRNKGASRPASLSFLVTTPESSVDSILFTWGLMGPVMAVARPIAAMLTAVLGGLWAIFGLKEENENLATPAACADGCGDSCQGEENEDKTERGNVVRRSLRYAFVGLLDELAFWLVLGLLVAGLIGALLPADLASWGLGSGVWPILAMLVVGVPLYMCASASTPIAAALMVKGLSPGAALAFLLAGPATNAASIVVLAKTFGRRFVTVYLASVVLGAFVCGLALDLLVVHFAWQVALPAGLAADELFAPLAWISLAVLVIALTLSFQRGAGAMGWRELKESVTALLPRKPPSSR